MNNLQKLHADFNQSPWLDNLSRDLLQSGRLEQYVKDGIRGLTSNPTILEHAITTSDLYDAQIKSLAHDGLTTEQIYWKIVEQDIKAATTLLKPLWDETGGVDGYVSLEVSPNLADETDETITQARRLWAEVDSPNLMIKVPATEHGVPVVRTLLSDGINVNVTLIFSLDHYRQVAEAHLATHALGMINNARSVASFFISRVDSEVDARLNTIGTPVALELRGKAAIAQARLAYGVFLDNFAKTAVLDNNSPAIQRLLWASTSTKNPDYDNLLYVSSLLAPYTVNTLPEETIANIVDHLPEDAHVISLPDIAAAKRRLDAIEAVGVDLKDVSRTLESQGVKKFQDSFAALLAAIETKSQL
ncbi:MAG: Transaldolase [Candidatus Saccharibacteria bacterium]|nr:Transaldolase [Candidatus Saccharibacteria bacterium]